MEFRKLKERDVCEFSELIENMYSGLENLEWFTPMPFDEENVLNMIQKPRFYILGAFEDNKLVGVSSLDYKCGKLLGKIDFPENAIRKNSLKLDLILFIWIIVEIKLCRSLYNNC